MLRLENVDKYFFRHKKNEIHVINNTSLTLDDTGLVALLGPSGCGKTTLLNAIGGLDNVNRGKIYVNGQKLSRKGSYKRDKIRVLNIGYIFQDYNLIENISVFENVALSLKMIGIKNKQEIKRRVDYVLEKVGMYRYRNKPAGMLSGGEKQRVGIARAIVKNPLIIIADEPTGNLDSKNTIDIMNIIKSISKDKLVILVTHEANLANFYASRIIDIQDGRIISDRKNDHEDELDYRIDNKIYLLDFPNHKKISENIADIDLYTDSKEGITLKIVVQKGNIYIQSDTKEKIEVIDESSNIELVNDKYKKITKKDYEKSNFDLKELDNSNCSLKYSSIYNPVSMLKSGFKKVYSYSLLKKILLVGFFVSAMFIVYSISNIFGITNIRDESFLSENRNYVDIKTKTTKVEDYLKIESLNGIEYMMPGSSVLNFELTSEDLYQLSGVAPAISGSITDLSLINNILIGDMPKTTSEVCVDKFVIDKAMRSNEIKMMGLNTYSSFVGKSLSIRDMKFKITCISDTKSPSIYIDKMLFMNILANDVELDNIIQSYEYIKDSISLKGGRVPTGDYEVIVNEDLKDEMPLGKTINEKVNGKKLKVVGYYFSKYGVQDYYVNDNTLKYSNIENNPSITIYSSDMEKLIETLKKEGFNGKSVYKMEKEEYLEDAKESITQHLIIAGILLIISFVEIYLMVRASFLSRIKEVGIYRAVGVKVKDIYKMFLGEILVITTLASVPGYIIMSLVLHEIASIKYLRDMYIMDFRVLITSIVLIYLLNILMGLLPIRRVVKKTPAAILARNDID